MQIELYCYRSFYCYINRWITVPIRSACAISLGLFMSRERVGDRKIVVMTSAENKEINQIN